MGNSTLEFLEIHNSDVFQDVSLAQLNLTQTCCCASSFDAGLLFLQWLATLRVQSERAIGIGTTRFVCYPGSASLCEHIIYSNMR